MNKHRLDFDDRLRSTPACIHSGTTTSLLLMLVITWNTVSAWQPAMQPLTATAIESVTGEGHKPKDAPSGSVRAEPHPLPDVQVASFKEVVPGTSTIDQVVKQLGEPASRAASADQTTLTYKIDPFEKVEMVISENLVQSIVVYLAKPNTVDEVATQLGLKGFVPATIADTDGKLLGQVYPERGILLSFASAQSAGDPLVAQIAIEQIDAVSFLYRAKYKRGHQYLAALEDLLTALKLNPNDAESHALTGELFMHSGRYTEAAKHIDMAIKLEESQPAHRLLKAKLLARQSKYAEAVAETKRVVDSTGVSELTNADAQEHLGYLLAIAQVPNFKDSLDNYTKAIKTANSLADDESDEVRVAAKRISFDAHLGVADNIARGPWKRNKEVSQKWVDRAAAIADELIESGAIDESLLWVLQQQKLTVLAGAQSTEDPSAIVDELIRLSKKLIAESKDPLFRSRVQFQTGRALINAAQLEQWGRRASSAIEYATLGAKLLDASAKHRDHTDTHAYRMGRAYFLIGSIHSILKRDHKEAIAWFDKAESNLRGPIPELYGYEKNIHGDRFISMGVSHWQVGEREKALKLTKHGIVILENAVKSGIAKPSSLKIPYGNYGNMQKQMGNDDIAKQYIERSAQLQGRTPPTRR